MCEGMRNCDPRNIARAPSTCGQPAKVRRHAELRPPQYCARTFNMRTTRKGATNCRIATPAIFARAPSTCGQPAKVRRLAELRSPQWRACTINMRTTRKGATACRIAIPAMARVHHQHADSPQRCDGTQNCDPRNTRQRDMRLEKPAGTYMPHAGSPQFERNADYPQQNAKGTCG